MKNGKKRNGENKVALTFLFSVAYFIITSLSFTLVIWIRYLLYKSPVFAPDHVPPHTSTFLLALMSIIIGTLLTVFSTRMILKPVRKILEAMNKVAEADYSVRVDPAGMKKFRKLGIQFNNMVEEIGSAEILKNDFINNFSHELKTPMTSILGFAKLLKRSDLSEEERNEYLDIIINESERLSSLSQNILTLSRLENQSILPDVQELNISEQIRLSVALFDSRLADKKLELDFDADECIILGNKTLLSQVWINLLDNAIKFSPEGSVIRITAHTEKSNSVITFSNHGDKLDGAKRKHLFDRFYQADESHKTEGNGLGLTLVSAIIKHHSGTIEITDDEEYEVIFRIELPETI